KDVLREGRATRVRSSRSTPSHGQLESVADGRAATGEVRQAAKAGNKRGQLLGVRGRIVGHQYAPRRQLAPDRVQVFVTLRLRRVDEYEVEDRLGFQAGQDRPRISLVKGHELCKASLLEALARCLDLFRVRVDRMD